MKKIVLTIISLIVIGVLALIGVLIAKSNSNNNKTTASKGANLTPKNVMKDGSFHITSDGSGDAKKALNTSAVRTQMYFDPMCPGCGIVDRGLHDRMSQLLQQKKIDLYMNPVAFLNNSSTDQYSDRAVNAIVTVNEKDPKNLFKFITELYKTGVQPKEATEYKSVSDDDLAKTAERVGVPTTVAESFKKHDYITWVQKHTYTINGLKSVFPNGISTPMILMGGGVDSGDNPTKFTQVPFDGSTPVGQAFDSTLSKIQSQEGKK